MNNSVRHSPFLALLWKEWRELWWLLILTAVAPALCLYSAGMGVFHPQLRVSMEVIAIGLFFLFPLILGAELSASEKARGTIAFLRERPLTARLLWKARVFLPIAAMLTSYALCAAVHWFAADAETSAMLPRLTRFICIAVGLIMSGFGAGALMSVVADKTITAVAGGGALWLVISFLLELIARVMTLSGLGNAHWRIVLPALFWGTTGIVLLLLSRFVLLRQWRD